MPEDREDRSKETRRAHVRRMPPRPHPKPKPASPASLNQAVRQELWYLDTMMAAPFRTLRRLLAGGTNPLAEGLDEMLWAWEGMSRLPVKLLQAAFGEEMGSFAPSGGAEARPASTGTGPASEG